ncbi:MAG: hypothetical protein FRX48_05365 [Lasallia pustulata]|uniref:Uncharacterized protein n=1 Tax=Lasallia pustulata TaxID=136370 RepID=A0A5M8PQ51_9LECA|nr:MAG: hypothetical protein FRX48_05365 [Lasallia pustulata]
MEYKPSRKVRGTASPRACVQSGPKNSRYKADVYSNGRSEEIIGKAPKEYDIPSSKVAILSQCYIGINTSGKQPPISALIGKERSSRKRFTMWSKAAKRAPPEPAS